MSHKFQLYEYCAAVGLAMNAAIIKITWQWQWYNFLYRIHPVLRIYLTISQTLIQKHSLQWLQKFNKLHCQQSEASNLNKIWIYPIVTIVRFRPSNVAHCIEVKQLCKWYRLLYNLNILMLRFPNWSKYLLLCDSCLRLLDHISQQRFLEQIEPSETYTIQYKFVHLIILTT